MIPQVIHYCWFGKAPLPKSARKCIASWRTYFPDYEIKEWNEKNFDVNIIPYTTEAYKAKKYAFVSDFARFWILYHHGGVYFDTDVEVIKSFDDIIARGPFMGCESGLQQMRRYSLPVAFGLGVNPGLGLGVNPGLGLYKQLLERYEGIHFQLANGSLNLTTVVDYTTKLLTEHGLKNVDDIQQIAGCWIYPSDYFCPISTVDGKLYLTENTHSIHHYDQSWQHPIRKNGRKLILRIGGYRLKLFLKKLMGLSK